MLWQSTLPGHYGSSHRCPERRALPAPHRYAASRASSMSPCAFAIMMKGRRARAQLIRYDLPFWNQHHASRERLTWP